MKLFKNALAVIISFMIIASCVPLAFAVSDSIMSYCPDGARLLSVDGTAFSSSPYEGSAGWWSVSNINDGKLQNETGGFTTSVSEDVPDEYTPAWILIDLEGYYYINRTVIFPYGAYPDSYRIEVSADGESFTQVASDSGLTKNRTVKSYDFSSPRARYLRLYITKRGDFDGNSIRLVQLAELAVFGTPCTPTNNDSDITTYSPENCINIAPLSKVTCDDSIESENGRISLAHLTNGVVGDSLFFSTQSQSENYDDVDIDFDLGQYADVKRVNLFTWGIFPKDFEIQLSLDGANYTTVDSFSGLGWRAGSQTDLAGSHFARYVRVHITGRNHGTETEENCYYVQLGEIGIYAVKDAVESEINKNAVTLRAGESIPIENTVKTKSIYDLDHNIQWSVEDTGVAYYDNGEIKTVSIGKTKLTCFDSTTGITLTCDVTVKERYDDITDGVIISTYGPGWNDLLTSEQFKLLADAGIDLVYGVGGGSVKDNRNALKYAYENGMNYMVTDYSIYAESPHLSKEEINALYEQYRGMSGLGGIYLTDEPKNPNKDYVRPYNILKEIEPELFVHLNCLPGFVYDSYEQYEFQLDDYAVLTNNTDYIMFDIYPFLYDGGIEYERMFDSYDAVRRSGLKNDVKTACYIQAVGYGGVNSVNFAKRVPTAADVLYQDMISLAYGMKHLSYFKWGPGGSSPTEKFSDGGIDKDGNPTQTYYYIQTANSQVHALGKTLANLDAQEVYLNGSNTYSQPAVPEGFFVHSSADKSLVFSYLKDRDTGRNYLMVVNNDVVNSVTAPLNFAGGINKISIADNSTGEFEQVNISGSYSLTLAAGDAALIALPESYRYEGAQPEQSANLALHKRVTGTSSIGEDGWYLNCLTDGYTYDKDNKGLNGWCSVKSESSYETAVTVDLGESKIINSLSLYAADSATGCRDYFPKSYTLSVSADNQNWQTIVTQQDAQVQSKAVFTFASVNARYVKLSVNDMNCVDGLYAAAVSEIEITAEPKVERIKTVSESPDGYYVYAFCAGADYVKMPTWTQKAVNGNAQDDIIWYTAQEGSWTVNGREYNYMYYVPVSDHNGEHGMYNTHVYAYNSTGNHALATVFKFTNDYVFDVNCGSAPRNLITGLENAASGKGVTSTYNSADDTITLNGTLTGGLDVLSYTNISQKFNSGDKIRVSIEFLSGSANGYVVFDFYNDLYSAPLGKRKYHDFTRSGSYSFVIDFDELADEISAYKLWLYHPGSFNPEFSSLKIRVKLEVCTADEFVYSPSGRSVEYGSLVGALPEPPQREDALFLGWYTQPEGGERVTESTYNSKVGSTVLYARWQEAETVYIYSDRQRMTTADFASEYVSLNNETAEYTGTFNGFMATGSTVNIRSGQTGKITRKYIFVLYGDLDSDGVCDGRDAVYFSSIEAGMLNETNTAQAVLSAADCVPDGVKDSADYDYIINSGLLISAAE